VEDYKIMLSLSLQQTSISLLEMRFVMWGAARLRWQNRAIWFLFFLVLLLNAMSQGEVLNGDTAKEIEDPSISVSESDSCVKRSLQSWCMSERIPTRHWYYYISFLPLSL
jgi:hypothetical protein